MELRRSWIVGLIEAAEKGNRKRQLEAASLAVSNRSNILTPAAQFKRLYRNCPGRKNPAQSCLVCRGSPDRDLTFLGTNLQPTVAAGLPAHSGADHAYCDYNRCGPDRMSFCSSADRPQLQTHR